MNRVLTLAAACLLGTASLSAQNSVFSTAKSSEGVKFGIRTGVNLANMGLSYENASLSFNSRTGFHAGVIADIPVVESFYIQPGLYLSQKGFKYKGSAIFNDSKHDDANIEAKPLYLEVPVLASFRFNVANNVQLLANAGPYFAYGIGGKGTAGISGKSESEDFFSDGINRFDCGLSFGAGVQFARHYYLGFAYELGLTNIIDADIANDLKMKNRNWTISLGYNF